MKKKIIFLLIGIIFNCCSNKENIKDHQSAKSIDSINVLLPLLNDNESTDIQKERYVQKLLNFSEHINNDSLKNEAYFKISYELFKNKKFKEFYILNQKSLKLSQKFKDTIKIAALNWDLASYYLDKNINDSAFFYYNQAERLYNLMSMDFNTAKVQLNVAILQKNVKDYTGGEINTIKAIRNFEKLNNYKYLYSSYNNLGIIYNELEEYDKSIIYHKKALNFLNKIENGKIYYPISINNIGMVYQNMGKLSLSEEYFSIGLNIIDLEDSDPELYAMLLDNFAYSRFLDKQNTNIESDFLKALNIRKTIHHDGGVTINKIHLGEYYVSKEDTSKAYKYFEEAYSLAKETNNYRDILSALLQISKIDKENRLDLINNYIRINDSLLHQERIIRNKFTRIQFETDEYISENKYLSEKNRNMLWLIIMILILFSTIYIIRNQKIKFDKLKMSNRQQEANEEIYNLLLISQNKLEEGRENEKKRISKELHDGVLSKFFGVRLNLEILNDEIDIKSIQERKNYIQGLKDLETEIRAVSHQLNEDTSSLENNIVKIINELFLTQSKISNFRFQLDIDKAIIWDEISNKIKINIYRIIQEGIHNINKHSEADFVKLNIEIKNFNLIVALIDNGVGFNQSSTSNGIGLSNMKSRINDLSGKIEIISNNTGTKIIMEIPI